MTKGKKVPVRTERRAEVLRTIPPFLRFFALGLLSVEAVTVGIGAVIAERDRLWIFLGGLIAIVTTIAIVGFLVYQSRRLQPHAANSTSSPPEQSATRAIPAEAREYEAFDIESLMQMGKDPRRILDSMIELDYERMEGLNVDHEGSKELIYDKWLNYPECGKIIVCNHREAVGYWSFMPLRNEIYERFKAGQAFDNELTLQAGARIEEPGIYHAYFAGIALMIGHSNIRAKKVLLASIAKAIASLARDGVFFEDMCANAFTEDGVALCEHFGMRHICDHRDKGKIYYREMFPFPERSVFQSMRGLQALYEEKFRGLRRA